jgi:thymidine kinase
LFTPKGSITIITGPMFSGKSEITLRVLRRDQIARRNVLLLRHVIDDRTPPEIVISRSGATFPSVALASAAEIVGAVQAVQADVVAIEEGEFWDVGIVEAVSQLAAKSIKVIVNGLNQDFRGLPFGAMPELLALADEIILLSAVCQVCGEEATKTQRLNADGTPASAQSELLVVGGLEAAPAQQYRYEARCRRHHFIG